MIKRYGSRFQRSRDVKIHPWGLKMRQLAVCCVVPQNVVVWAVQGEGVVVLKGG